MVALKEGALTLKWLKLFLEELGLPIIEPIPCFQDNLGVVETLKSDSYRHRLRHKMNTVSAVRELIGDETIRVVAVSTQRQLADIGTKALGKHVFGRLCAMVYSGWNEEVRTPG